MLTKSAALAWVVMATSMPPGARPAPPTFTVTRIGTLGGCCSTPTDINNKGWVVGQSLTAEGHSHAFLWTNDSSTDLGFLPGDTQSTATGVNDLGEVLCTSGRGFFDSSKVMIWKNGGTQVMTIPMNGFPGAISSAINDSGSFVGHFSGIEGGCLGFAWIRDSLYTIDCAYSLCPCPLAVNDRNQVAVGSPSFTDVHSPCLWEQGQSTTLSQELGAATCINERGQIAGCSARVDSASGEYSQDASVWRSGGMRAFAFQTGERGYGSSRDINESGLVVGFSGQPSRAFLYLWDTDTLYDLNDLIPAGSGWTLEEAAAISDSGWIVGTGTYQEQANQGFLLTPVTTSASSGFRASREPCGGVAFRIAREGRVIVIRMSPGLPPNGEIRILDNRGRLVRRLPASGGGRAVWDGRDAFGRPVAEGAYVIMVRDRDAGTSGTVLFTK